MSDGTRVRGFADDLSRRIRALRDQPTALVLLRALDRAVQILERDDQSDDSPLACALREAVHDIEAEERADDEAHERARDEMVPRRRSEVCEFDPPIDGSRHERSVAAIKAIYDRDRRAAAVTIGLPGDDLSERMVVDEFADEQHLTTVAAAPDLALVTAAEPYAELDVSDADQPIAVHAPGGESG